MLIDVVRWTDREAEREMDEQLDTLTAWYHFIQWEHSYGILFFPVAVKHT
jgi:hypothetical protein